jgi:hypothetical protein
VHQSPPTQMHPFHVSTLHGDPSTSPCCTSSVFHMHSPRCCYMLLMLPTAGSLCYVPSSWPCPGLNSILGNLTDSPSLSCPHNSIFNVPASRGSDSWQYLVKMAAFNLLAVCCRCSIDIRDLTGQFSGCGKAISAMVLSARHRWC